MELRIFYDGHCPLCAAEMRKLKLFDDKELIELQDINAKDFSQRFSYIDYHQANQILHGETASGKMLFGLDVTCKAWSLTGKYRWISILRLPLIKPIADWCYLKFAKHRYRITALLTGQSRCTQGKCDIDN